MGRAYSSLWEIRKAYKIFVAKPEAKRSLGRF
jgi:hypothetical protein